MPKAGSLDRPAYRFYRWYWRSFDWLFPPVCGGCGKPGSRWCQECDRITLRIPTIFCIRCGNPYPGKGVCARCRLSHTAYKAIRSWAEYAGPVRNALQKLKYRKNIALGDILAQPLIELYKQMNWSIDLIIPVPLSSARLRERGYNQVSYLAKPLAIAIGLPYSEVGISRVSDHPSQVGLSRQERRQNIVGSFRANRKKIKNQRILVIDDVTTTGATMHACSEELVDAGALEVYGLTLARAVHHVS